MNTMEIRKHVRKIDVAELTDLIATAEYHNPEGTTVTLCYLHLNCGITLTGTSGCLNPDDYDAEIGQKIAHDNAFKQLWQLEGYARMRVFIDGLEKADVAKPVEGEEPWQTRIRFEHVQLIERMNKLSTFIYSEAFENLDKDAQTALENQLTLMNQYAEILQHRLGLGQ